LADEVFEPDAARHSYPRCRCAEARLERRLLMIRKLVATSFLAGAVIVGGLAVANAAHNPGESVTPMSNSTTTTTSTTATNAPGYQGHMGY
jgi:hypothetical protein